MPDIKAVTIIRSGGFAGTVRQYWLSADNLPEAQRHELERLTQSLAKAAGRASAEKRMHPDSFDYEIRIQTNEGEAVHHVGESGSVGTVRSLLKLCSGH
jgi:hypothetical protein